MAKQLVIWRGQEFYVEEAEDMVNVTRISVALAMASEQASMRIEIGDLSQILDLAYAAVQELKDVAAHV